MLGSEKDSKSSYAMLLTLRYFFSSVPDGSKCGFSGYKLLHYFSIIRSVASINATSVFLICCIMHAAEGIIKLSL